MSQTSDFHLPLAEERDGRTLNLELDDETILAPDAFSHSGLALRLNLDEVKAIYEFVDDLQVSLSKAARRNPVFQQATPDDWFPLKVEVNLTRSFDNVASLRFTDPAFEVEASHTPRIEIGGRGDYIDIFQSVGLDADGNGIRLFVTLTLDDLLDHLDRFTEGGFPDRADVVTARMLAY